VPYVIGFKSTPLTSPKRLFLIYLGKRCEDN
jgi:hypothetical protein